MPVNWAGITSFFTTVWPLITAFIQSLKPAPAAAFASHKASLHQSLIDGGVIEADAQKAIAWVEANWVALSATGSTLIALVNSLISTFTTAA